MTYGNKGEPAPKRWRGLTTRENKMKDQVFLGLLTLLFVDQGYHNNDGIVVERHTFLERKL